MSFTHLIAAVVTIVMFRYAEVAFWGLLVTARLYWARLLTTVAAVRVRAGQRQLPLHAPDVPTFATRFLSAMRYRGPPLATFTA
jgi:hypothetical protein